MPGTVLEATENPRVGGSIPSLAILKTYAVARAARSEGPRLGRRRIAAPAPHFTWDIVASMRVAAPIPAPMAAPHGRPTHGYRFRLRILTVGTRHDLSDRPSRHTHQRSDQGTLYRPTRVADPRDSFAPLRPR